MAAAATLGFARGLVFAAVLGPEGFGYYSLLVLIAGFGLYVCTAGLDDGMLREISWMVAGDRIRGSILVRNEVLTTVVGLTSVVMVIWLIAVVLLVDDKALKLTLALAGPFTLSSVLFRVTLTDLRARQRLVPFASSLTAKNLLVLLVGVWGALEYGFPGVIAAEAGGTLLATVSVIAAFAQDFRFRIPRVSRIAKLGRVGLWFTANNALRNAAVNIDRWFVALALPVSMLGQYSFAMNMYAGGMVISNIVGLYFAPQMVALYLRSGDLKPVWNASKRIASTLAILMIVGGVAVVGLAALMIPSFFPDYVPSIGLIPVIFVGVAIQVTNVFDWVALAAGQGRPLTRVYVVVCLAAAVLGAIAAFSHAGLLAFAMIFLVARAVNFVGNWHTVRRMVVTS